MPCVYFKDFYIKKLIAYIYFFVLFNEHRLFDPGLKSILLNKNFSLENCIVGGGLRQDFEEVVLSLLTFLIC